MGEGSAMQEQLPRDAAVERTRMYLQRVPKRPRAYSVSTSDPFPGNHQVAHIGAGGPG